MNDFPQKAVRISFIVIGILSAGLGLRGFLIPNHFIDGGVTNFKGSGGSEERPKEILYCVVTRFEIPKITDAVKSIDEKAFMVVTNISDTSGGIVRSPLSPVLQAVNLHEEKELEDSIAPDIDISITPDRFYNED